MRLNSICTNPPFIPQGDVIYLHEPLLWTLRQHATNGVSGPDSLARAIGAVAPPLLEITARVGEFGGDVKSCVMIGCAYF